MSWHILVGYAKRWRQGYHASQASLGYPLPDEWLTPLTLVLRRWRQDSKEFKDSQGYMRPCLRKQTKEETGQKEKSWGAALQQHHNLWPAQWRELLTECSCRPVLITQLSVCICCCLWVYISFCIFVSVSDCVCLFMSACLGVLSATGSWGRCW